MYCDYYVGKTHCYLNITFRINYKLSINKNCSMQPDHK